jgi:hypothetical protein
MRDYCIIEPQANNQNNNKYKALDMGILDEDIKFSLAFVFIAIIDLICPTKTILNFSKSFFKQGIYKKN